MGIENFYEFCSVVKNELKTEGIEIEEEKLKRAVSGLDHHGKNVGPGEYDLLAESFVAGIYYINSLYVKRR